jgi:hypothetical protein
MPPSTTTPISLTTTVLLLFLLLLSFFPSAFHLLVRIIGFPICFIHPFETFSSPHRYSRHIPKEYPFVNLLLKHSKMGNC